MGSAAWQVVAVLPPARVPVLAASSWPPLVLAQALAVALTPRALAQQLVFVLMMPRALVQGPRAALGSVLQGP